MFQSQVALQWPFYPSVLGGVLLLTGGYLAALTRWRGRFPGSRPPPRGRIAAFLLAMASIVLALHTPIDQLGDRYLFSVHMVQHMLLTLVMPPLLLYGLPGWIVRPLLVRWPALLALGRALTRPVVAFGLFNAVFTGYHLPAIYDTVQASELLHILSHLVFMATGVITWWPVLSPLPELPRLPHPAQLLYLFLQTLPGMLLGALLTYGSRVYYGSYERAPRVWTALSPVLDQQIGGLLMWIGGGTFFLGAFVLVFLRWTLADEARARRGVAGRARI